MTTTQIDLWVDDGMVGTGVKRFFQRPLRLVCHEAFALVAAAEAASTLPGADSSGALASALEKVKARLGGAVEVVERAPRFADEVHEATRLGEIIEITYWTASRDEVTERRIIPRLVVTQDGDMYVVADDERSGE